jgi:HSP20 family protein
MMQSFYRDMDMFAGNGPWNLERSFGGWSPHVEAFQRDNEFVVRADLPGLKPEDVDVEVSDEAITIRGERKHEHEEQHEGYYRSERHYGSFHRTIPLPQGAITDSAKADFKNGVLEIKLQAPPAEVRRGRKIKIGEPTPS